MEKKAKCIFCENVNYFLQIPNKNAIKCACFQNNQHEIKQTTQRLNVALLKNEAQFV